jgi:hypothetical protein
MERHGARASDKLWTGGRVLARLDRDDDLTIEPAAPSRGAEGVLSEKESNSRVKFNGLFALDHANRIVE